MDFSEEITIKHCPVERRREGPQKARGVKMRAHHLQNWPGARLTTNIQLLSLVTCHCPEITPSLLNPHMEAQGWPSVGWTRSPHWDSDAPIKILLLITSAAVSVMWFMVSLFNRHVLKYSIGKSVSFILPCSYKVKQPQLSRKCHRNDHIIGQRRIIWGSCQPFHMLHTEAQGRSSSSRRKKSSHDIKYTLWIKAILAVQTEICS